MNVSMQDTFNLGWKLASVIRGHSSPHILQTYSSERQGVAQELIDFDREFAKMFSTKPRNPSDPKSDGLDAAEFQRYFVKLGRFTAGTATHYPKSLISGEPAYSELAKEFVVGMRFHSASVIRLADAKPVHLGHTIKADGRWRLFLFAAAENPSVITSKIRLLCEWLEQSARSPVRRYTPHDADADSIFDVRAVFQQGHREIAINAMPPFLLPRKGRYGLIDYEKMFCPDFGGAGDVFELRGIDREKGCIIVVRPDQYVSNILPLDAYDELADFFDGFMIPRTPFDQ